MISQKEREREREREREDWLLNLRQLRFNGEVINRRNISNLFGGEMMCIYLFIFWEEENDELRERYR